MSHKYNQKQFLDVNGLQCLWNNICNAIEHYIKQAYDKFNVKTYGDHSHDVNISGKISNQLTASYEDGILTLSNNDNIIEIIGNTSSAGAHQHITFEDNYE